MLNKGVINVSSYNVYLPLQIAIVFVNFPTRIYIKKKFCKFIDNNVASKNLKTSIIGTGSKSIQYIFCPKHWNWFDSIEILEEGWSKCVSMCEGGWLMDVFNSMFLQRFINCTKVIPLQISSVAKYGVEIYQNTFILNPAIYAKLLDLISKRNSNQISPSFGCLK